MKKLSLQEAYDAARKFGNKVYVADQIFTLIDHDERFAGSSIHVDDVVVSGSSLEDCLKQVAEADPEQIRKDKIAKLKAELSELEA